MTEALIQFLKAKGFNPENFSHSTFSADRETALMCAAKEGNFAVANELLDLGANPDLADEGEFGGHTPLIRAAENNHPHLIDLLLKRKANPDLMNALWGQTALLCAAEWGHKEAVLALLKNGIPINQTGRNGRTAMSYAADTGREELIRILLKHKADVNHRTNNCGTPISFATLSGRRQIAEFLLQSKADLIITSSISPLNIAAIGDNGKNGIYGIMLNQITFLALIEARNLRQSIQSKEQHKGECTASRLASLIDFKNHLQQYVMQFTSETKITDEKRQQEINTSLQNVLDSVLKQTAISPVLDGSLILNQGLIQQVLPNLGRDLISRILGFLQNGYGETVHRGIEKLYAEYVATTSKAVFFYFRISDTQRCPDMVAYGARNKELPPVIICHQKPLVWQKKDKDELDWEKFKKSYNKNFPTKEAEGYGPGAVVVKRFS